jgi:hypothetical protein
VELLKMDNRAFWNNRYSTLPQLGSGPGSRGWAADFKRQLVTEIVSAYQPQVLLDIGCGDQCWLSHDLLSKVSYIGVDISDLAV